MTDQPSDVDLARQIFSDALRVISQLSDAERIALFAAASSWAKVAAATAEDHA